MRPIMILPMLALVVAGCTPAPANAPGAAAQPAAASGPTTAPANAAAAALPAAGQTTAGQPTGVSATSVVINGQPVTSPAGCTAAGPAGSQTYNACVAAFAPPNADQMRAQIQQQIAQQRAQMQQQMQRMQNQPGCVTTRDANNNVVTQCP